jgi:hypothetical protein
MADLTGEDVISAVTSGISDIQSTLGISKIYKNLAIQNMVKPCIFVGLIEGSQDSEMNNRSQRNSIVEVRAHPDQTITDIYTWSRSLAEKLLPVLHKISVSSQIVKAQTVSWAVRENVLQLIATYRFKVIYVEDLEETLMENLEYYGEVK